ncbi:NAD-binding protein [Micromonospora sp. NPDC000089]|uniref:NAD-binding protein n=1 Tax=unclassified Micromonospora TaxID=2617518 RepID=UPI0036C82BAB
MNSDVKPRIAVVGGGMAGLELAAALAARGAAHIEVIERGPATRRDHILWDRETYPGDEKTRRWTGEGWGADGGLSERLGGRSLCYHGVLLGIEPYALDAWPTAWVDRLAGPKGYYRSIPAELEPAFPELWPARPSAGAAGLGLRHVPQAVRVLDDGRRLTAYTPLTAVMELARSRALEIVRAAAVRVEPKGARSWTVEVVGPDGAPERRGPFDACVLAASAIGNVQLLSRSLDREMETNLTDHLCVGGLVRLPAGVPLNEFRHRKVWSGYLPVSELDANIFVREFEPLPNGDRFLDIHAVVEQDDSDQGSSTLLASPTGTNITPVLSTADEQKLAAVQDRVRDIACAMGQESVRSETEMRGTWTHAQESIHRQAAHSVAYYQLPYGEYEHESATHPIGGAGITIGVDLDVEELPGVYVTGPGAFPRIGAANPALTILSMSRSLATILSDRYAG